MAAKRLEVIITGEPRGLQRAFAASERSAGSFGRKMSSVGATVAKSFAVVGVAGGAAAVAVGAGLYKIGADFDAAYDKIRVGTGQTGYALNVLKNDFRQVVSNVPADFGDASTAVADLNTRLGITGPTLQAMSAQFLELSRITETDLSANIDTATRLFGDWGVQVDQQSATLDKLFRATQVSGVGFDTLAGDLVKFGAPLRNLGFSIDDGMALLAQFNKTGVNTQTVFAGLKAGVGKLAKAGEDVPATFRRVVGEIQKLGPGTKATALAIELFGQRAGPDLADAIAGGKFSLDEMSKAITSGSDTIMKAGKETQDFSEKWKLLKNKIWVGLEPLATSVFSGVAAAIDKITPTVTEVIGGVRAFVAAFKAGGDEVTSSGLAGWFERFGLKARKAFDAVRPSIVKLSGWVSRSLVPAIANAGEWIGARLPGWIEAGRAAIGRIGEVVATVVAAVQQRWPQIQQTFAEVTATVSSVMASLKSIVSSAVDFIQMVWRNWGANIVHALSGAFNNVRQIISGQLEIVRGIFETFAALLRGDWSGAWEGLKHIVHGAFNTIVGIAKNAGELLRLAVTVTLEVLHTAMQNGWDAIGKIPGLAWEGIKIAVAFGAQWVVDRVKAMPAAIAGASQGMWDGIKNAFRAALNWIIDRWNDFKIKLPEIDPPGPGPTFPGYTLSMPQLPRFHGGGVIPGRIGTEVPIMAQAGERVLSIDEARAAGRGAPVGGGMSIVNHFQITEARDGEATARAVVKILNKQARYGQPTLIPQATI